MQVPIGISNRHIHLSQEYAEVLFGKDYAYKRLKDLTQKGQFALQETVTIENNGHQIQGIRVLGPRRSQTQIELLRSDTYTLWLSVPIKLSGDLQDTPGIKIIGPNGSVDIASWVIVAQRHLHISDQQAQEMWLTKGQIISITTSGIREITFHNVIVRSWPDFDLDFHIDIDEANAAGLTPWSFGTITTS